MVSNDIVCSMGDVQGVVASSCRFPFGEAGAYIGGGGDSEVRDLDGTLMLIALRGMIDSSWC